MEVTIEYSSIESDERKTDTRPVPDTAGFDVHVWPSGDGYDLQVIDANGEIIISYRCGTIVGIE